MSEVCGLCRSVHARDEPCRICGYVFKLPRANGEKVCEMSRYHYADPDDFTNGAERGHGKPAWWARRDLCPNKAAHASEVFGKRMTERYTTTRDGVNTTKLIDGVVASKNYVCEFCPDCELCLIWRPKSAPK